MLPTGEGPRPHRARAVDPRAVEAHFAPLLAAIDPQSAEQRLARKVDVAFRL